MVPTNAINETGLAANNAKATLVFPRDTTTYVAMNNGALPLIFEFERPDLGALLQLKVDYALLAANAPLLGSPIKDKTILDFSTAGQITYEMHNVMGSDGHVINTTAQLIDYVPSLAAPNVIEGSFRLKVRISYVTFAAVGIEGLAASDSENTQSQPTEPLAGQVEHDINFSLNTTGESILDPAPANQTCGDAAFGLVLPVHSITEVNNNYYAVLDPISPPHQDTQPCTRPLNPSDVTAIVSAAMDAVVKANDNTTTSSGDVVSAAVRSASLPRTIFIFFVATMAYLCVQGHATYEEMEIARPRYARRSMEEEELSTEDKLMEEDE
ncbi:hypothetical protein SEUCBS139899_004299 [Sporothrix eucalyptigena]